MVYIRRRRHLLPRLTRGVRSIAISVSVCLSLCPLAYLKTTRPNFASFFPVHVTRAVEARSSSDDTAIRYVFPVL